MSRIVVAAAALLAMSGAAFAQAQGPQPNAGMNFFITSASPGKGADLGGLDGADAHCQRLAAAVGQGGKTWRAYLSQQAMDGKTAVNAKDRIGKGPYLNFKGEEIAKDLAGLHDPAANKINLETGLTERGQKVQGRGFLINMHDILTGTQADGTTFPPDKDMTCGNWTKSGAGAAMVGHHDRMGLDDSAPAKSWNASHPSRGAEGGCSAADLRSTGGGGLLYCFAAN
ncbi:MAG: lectin [Methylobacteriaceae bacterium]|nr:lectin [Methylobacteriaceae bacterium]